MGRISHALVIRTRKIRDSNGLQRHTNTHNSCTLYCDKRHNNNSKHNVQPHTALMPISSLLALDCFVLVYFVLSYFVLPLLINIHACITNTLRQHRCATRTTTKLCICRSPINRRSQYKIQCHCTSGMSVPNTAQPTYPLLLPSVLQTNHIYFVIKLFVQKHVFFVSTFVLRISYSFGNNCNQMEHTQMQHKTI